MKKAIVILLIVILMGVSVGSSAGFCVASEDTLDNELFKFVWDDTLGVLGAWGGYCIVSDKIFPLEVYAVSLPDVGNYRVSNRSAVVEGVRKTTKIYLGDADVKELVIPLWFNLIMKLNVSISLHLVEDWETYKTLVETGNNTIIVNTHDEYLPVPDGFRKEEWMDKIADFMLNRWGTWVHAGGYPFYRVWYQNRTQEEWLENGFKHLMGYIGKGNVTCYPPPSWRPDDPATLADWAAQNLGINWYLYGHNIGYFHYADQSFPINYEDFKGQFLGRIYSYRDYMPGSIIRYSYNQSAFYFGIYIHMSAWQFYDIDGIKLPSEPVMGFISTAAAIYEEFSYSACNLYGRAGDSASEAIQKAEKEGRTAKLAEAKSLFQNSLDAFADGNYKLAATYAMQAKETAEKATVQSALPQTIALIAIVIASAGVGTYYKIKNNKNKKEESG